MISRRGRHRARSHVGGALLGAAIAVSGLAPVPGVATSAAGADPGSATFTYTGAAQTWTVPDGVTAVAVEVDGAQGGDPDYGGLGGRVQATLAVTPGETLQVNVGGQGAWLGGGFGGGGGNCCAWGGGGASDIRRGGTTLNDRVVVAGGGGAAGQTATT